MTLISVIIPTYNRLHSAQVAAKSVLQQVLPPQVKLEIIVVNDGSTDPHYHTFSSWPKGITLIHLPRNTRHECGFVNVNYVRNCGIRMSHGDYVCFLDDDDAWFPYKIMHQLEKMRHTKSLISCTEGGMGKGPYQGQSAHQFPRRNKDHFGSIIKHKFQTKELPQYWQEKHVSRWNPVIFSSLMIHKSVLHQIQTVLPEEHATKKDPQNIEFLTQLLRGNHDKILYLEEPLVYIDQTHGGGQRY